MHQIERNDGDMTEPPTRPDRKSSEELPEIQCKKFLQKLLHKIFICVILNKV